MIFGHDPEPSRRAARYDLGEAAALIAWLEEPIEKRSELREAYLRALDEYAAAAIAVERAKGEEHVAAAVRSIAALLAELCRLRARVEATPQPRDLPPCLFDPAHGPAARFVVWAPPGGDPRPVPACAEDGRLVDADGEPCVRTFRTRPYWDSNEHVAWFLGHFGGATSCSPWTVLAGTRLGDELARIDPHDELPPISPYD